MIPKSFNMNHALDTQRRPGPKSRGHAVAPWTPPTMQCSPFAISTRVYSLSRTKWPRPPARSRIRGESERPSLTLTFFFPHTRSVEKEGEAWVRYAARDIMARVLGLVSQRIKLGQSQRLGCDVDHNHNISVTKGNTNLNS